MHFTESPRRGAWRAARLCLGLGLLSLSACQAPRPPSGPAPGVTAPGAQAPASTAAEYRLRIARRLVAANPGRTYLTPAPEPLLAIPVLAIEVDAAGRVRRIEVMRRPSDEDAQDTVQLAIDAVRRAAPFGDATHVPRPWKFTEVFLFDDDRRFKPQLLD